MSSLPGASVITRDVRDETLGFFNTLFGFLFFLPLTKSVPSHVTALGYVSVSFPVSYQLFYTFEKTTGQKFDSLRLWFQV